MRRLFVVASFANHIRWETAACSRCWTNVDFSVAAGEAVSIAGTSGVGKTTLLHLLGGLDIPDSGSVAVGGRDWSELGKTAAADWRNKHLGFVFQFHLLLPEFSALENTACRF